MRTSGCRKGHIELRPSSSASLTPHLPGPSKRTQPALVVGRLVSPLSSFWAGSLGKPPTPRGQALQPSDPHSRALLLVPKYCQILGGHSLGTTFLIGCFPPTPPPPPPHVPQTPSCCLENAWLSTQCWKPSPGFLGPEGFSFLSL